MNDLVATFAALPRPSAPGSYSVDSEQSNCRVGKTFDGFPAVLVSLKNANGARLQRRLANFAYFPPAAVKIRTGTSSQTTELAIVECCTNEKRLASYFYRIVAQVLMPEADSGDEARFEAAIDAVITLFKSLQGPGQQTIQGLWAELAIIGFAASTAVALASWHSSPRALHDFANGSSRLEVKSTTKKLREHTFLLDQLKLGDPGDVLIASMLLTESTVGCSVFDLVSEIRNKLSSTEGQNRLEQIVADSLGDSFDDVEAHLYDLEAARLSLLFYPARDIPTCLLPLPPEVKSVSFIVDLSTTAPTSLDNARKLSMQFHDLLPFQ